MRVHIKPALGAVKLAALSAPDIQRFYNQLQQGKGDTPGLSPKTIKNVNGVLHKALDQAVAVGYIPANPCKGTDLPRVEKTEIKPLSDDAVTAFLKAIKDHPFERLFVVDLLTGMRIMGLTWDNVDVDGGSILIDRQLVKEKKKGGVYKFASPKNDKSRRITPPPSVMRVLREQRRTQNENKFKAGQAWNNPMNLVFTNELGDNLSHSTISHTFKRIMRRIGHPDTRFHDLRHTYAVAAIQSGVDIKTIQQNLGHYSVSFTLDVYGHVSDRMVQEAADRMEGYFESVKIL